MPGVRVTVILAIVAVLAAVLAWGLGADAETGENAAPHGVRAAAPPKRDAVEPVPSGTAQPVQARAVTPKQSLEQDFHDSGDLLTFIESIRPAAENGDSASAWWIYQALRRCDTEYRGYFERGGRIRTLDEALQINAGNRFRPAEEARKIHAQCARLRQADPEIANEWVKWLDQAASGDIALARIELAEALLTEAEKSGGLATAREAAQMLATEALQSGDAAAVAGMRVLAIRASGIDGAQSHFDWLVAGCQRGLDCGPQSAWVMRWCLGDPNCQPFEDVEAILRRISPAQYDGIEQRAREINRRIDENRIEELVSAMFPRK